MTASVIFDLDGTLLDSAPLCAEIMTAMRGARGRPAEVSHAEARTYASQGGHALVAGLLADLAGDPDQDLAEFRRLYASTPTPPQSLFPGVRNGLRQLHAQGTDLIVLSNKPQALCEKVVADLGLGSWFRLVVGARAGIPLKPDPTALEEIVQTLGISRRRAAYVGDSAVDHLVARAVGLPFVLVSYGYAEPDHVFADARVADSFEDVVAILEAGSIAASPAGAEP